jgi:hypothetical protein
MAVVVPIISTFDAKGITKAIADFKKLDNAGDKSASVLLSTNKAVNTLGKNFAKFGGIAAGVAGVVGGSLVKAAYESQKVMKQTEAIVAATGGAAGMTAKQVANFAESLSVKTGIDDEAIQSSLNLLLTFKQVRNEVGKGNDIFNRASMAALDLGNVFGSTDAAAKMLGKALSNPVKGINALQRAGVNFSDQQKEQIKTLVATGKTLEAQKMILKEVESQVGGTAVAGATGFDRMRVALGNAAEDLGTVLIPYVERFANFVIDKVVPVIEQFSTILGNRGLGGAFNYLVGSIVRGVWNMGNMGKTITVIIGLFGALKVAVITYTAVQTALTIAAQVTTGALKAQIVALNATKVAMLAAGGVTALLTIAASLYAIYAGNKSKATSATQNFTDALYEEGDAQKEAIKQLLLSSRNLSNLAFMLNLSGQGVGAFEEYLTKGTGSLKVLKERIDAAVKAGRGFTYWNESGQGFTVSAGDAKKYKKSLDELTKSQQQYIANQKLFKGLGLNIDTTDTDKAGKIILTAAEKFKKFGDAARTVVSDQKNLRDAFKNTVTAQKSLQTATDNVAAAQAKLNRIAQGYGAGSTEAQTAQEGLNRANRDATQAGYDLTKANYAVSDAEKALEQARRRNNPREIAEAEIALAEARFAQEDAQKAVADATTAVNTAQTNLNETINGAATTSDTYKNALIELQEAQDAQVEAIDKVRDAKERELEVTRNLAKAEILLRKAKGGLTKSQIAAANKLLKQLNTPVTVTVPSPTAGVGSTGSTVSMPSASMSGFDWSGISVGGLATLAEGGIAMKPTFALIAEGGEPEAVIPLSKMGAMGGDTIINVTVTSADPNAVVDALRRYQRQNGALPLRVQG